MVEPLPTRAASMSRIPSLDGLRALSIFLVIALHTIQRFGMTHHVSLIWFAIFNGDTGVFIFFVISGYLITSLLLHEQQKRGSISMGSFYFRRAMRILPPVYLYVAVLLLLGWAGRLAVTRIDIVSALFFFHNYALTVRMWSLEHFWTLSIEEQFYFIWPCILYYCLRHRPGIAGRMAAAKFALVVIVISPVIRVASFASHVPYLHHGGMFQMRADSLMFGCVIALLQGTPLFERVYSFVTKIWWIPPAVIFLSDCIGARFQNYWEFPFGFTLCGTAIAFFLLWCVRNPHSAVGNVLNSRPVMHIGVLSYSIYIWQTLFLHSMNASVFGPSLKIISTFPGNWVAILIVAELSYYVVEQPSLRLRNRLMRYIPAKSSKSVPLVE
ncbi:MULTISPECIES: acyltransferase [Acidobacteriaceae]|uniref:acyltransferase family protein n=1 Tax=Acidobacteriaceae TaxID=204434 RepID=UPI00131DFBCF|nr:MULTISPECIES: acyltransferase [Acidobacteriaceae]MDW5267831.1 acyltransferase [Edaphobacter sp.]